MANRPSRSAVASWALVGVAMGALIGGSITYAPPASAGACYSQPLNTVVIVLSAARGIKSNDMEVYDGDIDCSRVSSLWVENGTGSRHVEIGWYEDPVNYYVCLPNTSGSPKIIALSFEGPNDYACDTSPSTIAVGSRAFSVSDQNQNGIWQFSHAGQTVWTSPDLGAFTSGTLFNNGELGNTGNTSHSDFNQLRRMNAQGDWVDTTGAYEAGELLSDDPGARPCLYSDTHTAVKLNGTAC